VLTGARTAKGDPCVRRASLGRAPLAMLLLHWAHRRGQPALGGAAREPSKHDVTLLRSALSRALLEQARLDHEGFAAPARIGAALERVIALAANERDVQLARTWLDALPHDVADDGSYLGFLVARLHEQAGSMRSEYHLFRRPEHHRPPVWWNTYRVRDLAGELVTAGIAAVPKLLTRLDDPTVTRLRASDPTGYARVSTLVRDILGAIAGRKLEHGDDARAWWAERCRTDPFAAALQRAHDTPREHANAAGLELLQLAITPGLLRQ